MNSLSGWGPEPDQGIGRPKELRGAVYYNDNIGLRNIAWSNETLKSFCKNERYETIPDNIWIAKNIHSRSRKEARRTH